MIPASLSVTHQRPRPGVQFICDMIWQDGSASPTFSSGLFIKRHRGNSGRRYGSSPYPPEEDWRQLQVEQRPPSGGDRPVVPDILWMTHMAYGQNHLILMRLGSL